MVVLMAALVLGAAAALLKGEGSGVRDVLGNLSAPWLMVAFLAGGRSRSLWVGGALGLTATLMALAGFCLAFAFAADLGDHGFAGDVYLALRANSRYFLGALVSGPTFGVIGAWWIARRSARASIWIGLLLICEPLAIALISNVGSLARLAGGWAESDPRPYIGEFLLGLAVLAAGYLIGQLRPRAATSI
jgi:hypothetical protein